MPNLVSEITEGVGFSYSSEQGQVAAAQPRIFRVVLNEPGELINIEEVCGVRIGGELRPGAKLFCTSFDARYEGNSRMVLLCTFQFRNTPDASSSAGGQDPKSMPPDVRPADWSISSSLAEAPVYSWQRVGAINPDPIGDPGVPKNAAGDRFDSVTKLEPIVTISVVHWETNDPTTNVQHVGKINELAFQVGSLLCLPHTLMLRGITAQPAVESWGGAVYRGWNATYEFAYRANLVRGLWWETDAAIRAVEQEIGWDIAVPETGFNVIAFPPGQPRDDQDVFGQPLKHKDGKIDTNPLQLADGTAAGDRVRAMVKVSDFQDGGTSQAPSAQPVALNEDGTPRKSFGDGAADPPVIIKRYRVYDTYQYSNFNLRGLGN